MTYGVVVLALGVMAAQAAQAQDLEPIVRAWQNGDHTRVLALSKAGWEAIRPAAPGAGDLAFYAGSALTMLGRFERADLWFVRAGQSQKDNIGQGRVEMGRAVAAFFDSRKYSEGVPEAAIEHLGRARSQLGEGDVMLKVLEAELLGRSSDAEHVQRAFLSFRQLLAHFEQIGDSLNVARCAVGVARIDGSSGGHQDALPLFLRGARISKRAGDLQAFGWALRNAGHAQGKIGAYGEAERLLRQAQACALTDENQLLAACVWNDLSRLYMEMGRCEDALQADQAADDALTDLDAIARAQGAGSVCLDYAHMLKMRYASLLPYTTDLSADLGAYLALTK